MAFISNLINNPKVKKFIEIGNAIKNSGVEQNPSTRVEQNPSRSRSSGNRSTSSLIETNPAASTSTATSRPNSAYLNFNSAPVANPYTGTMGNGIVTNPNAGNELGNTFNNTLTPTEPATPTESITPDYIRKLNEAKLQNRINALKKSFNNTVSSLDEEEAKIKPMFYDARNKEAAQSDINAANFAQYMASRGIKGSAGAMPEINRLNALQGNLGRLDRQENEILADIARRRSLAKAELDSDIAHATSESEAELNLHSTLVVLKQLNDMLANKEETNLHSTLVVLKPLTAVT